MRFDPPSRLTPVRRQVLDRLLDQFLDYEDEERRHQLEHFKARYPRLQVWLVRLLAATTTPTGHFSAAVARTVERALPQLGDVPDLSEGERLGPWRILKPAGRGGMGVVYQAERADGAFEMMVAIKLIVSRHRGMAERLVQERQLLARLNHAGISRLIDGGLTDDGHAYLVMEWVAGEDLSERTRTGLDPFQAFAELADALTHAHQRMVVHGDIKPGNVRITPNGSARLLDFGVARLLAEEAGQDDESVRALTPAFAAPELFAGHSATAQSDIWALGALLNWMLTGTRPRGDGSPPDSSGIKHARAADLAAVIDRACAESPGARYPSVAALADELARIADYRPVAARPAGPMRRLDLWARRNPVGAVLALVLCIGTLLGAGGFAWQAQVVRAERDLAQFENTRWETMRDQLTGLFRVVAEQSDRGELGARELLDGSVQQLDELLAEDDRGRAYVEAMLGSLYIALQDFQSAALVLRRFVEADDGSASPMLRSDAYGDLGLAEVYLGNHEQALALIDQALAMVEGRPGDYRRRLSELHQTRGSALRGLGEWSASIASLEHALDLAMAVDAQPNRTLAMAHNNLGVSLNSAGRIDEARFAFEDSLMNWRAIGLGESSDALTVLSNLAAIYHQQGDLKRAETAYREAIDLRRRRFGESAALAAAMNNYAQILIIRHRLDEAAEQIEPAREMMARFNGENSPHHGLMLRSRGQLFLTAGQISEALDQFAKAEAIMLASVGSEHLFTALVQAQAAQAKAAQVPELAAERLEAVIRLLAALGEPAQTHKAGALCEQAVVWIKMERPELARSAAQRCHDIRLERLAESHWETSKAAALIDVAAHRQGDARARVRLANKLNVLNDAYGPGHPRLIWLESQLAP